VEELIEWFNTHEYENEVDLGEGQFIKDIKKCAKALTHTTLTQYANSTFSGSICNLFRIREELINQGKVKN
jgi:hypothetical protein